MCTASLTVATRRFDAPRLTAIGGAGLVTAAIGLLGFGTAHALIITPIWPRLLNGLPLTLLGGIALALAFDQLPAANSQHRLRSGFQFGGAMVATVLPATAVDTFLRITGIRRADNFEAAIAVILAVGAGAAVGWLWTRRAAAALAFAAAGGALLMTTAGPLPIAQSQRGLKLSLAIAPIIIAACLAISFLHRRFQPDNR